MNQLISINNETLQNKSTDSSNYVMFNNEMTKQEIKEIILLSLLDNYCRMNHIKDFNKITKEFSKLDLIDNVSIKNYTSDIRNKILNIISDIGVKNKQMPNISVSRINREYIISDNLGEGAAGTVFKALNIIDMSNYAIKKINLDSISPVYLREVRNLSKLSHPNVVKYYSTWIDFDNNKSNETNLCLYIQTELCDCTLKDILKNSLTKKEKIKLFYEIVKGVEYVHSNNIIHRDIKPANILIKYDDNKPIPKIADFGLSTMSKSINTYENILKSNDSLIEYNNNPIDYNNMKYITETYKKSYTEDVGTELYSSVEQLNSSDYDKRTDVYSLGIIYFEIINSFKNNFQRIDYIQQLRDDKYNSINKNNILNELNINKLDWIFINKLMDYNMTKRPSATDIKMYLEKRYKFCM